jgi:hypothetical protein
MNGKRALSTGNDPGPGFTGNPRGCHRFERQKTHGY